MTYDDQTEKKKKLSGQQGELMRALKITAEDLAANDEGYITESQRTALLKRQQYSWLPFIIVAGVFGMITAFMISLELFIAETAGILLVIGVLFWVLAIAFGGGALWMRQRLKRELDTSNVQTVQGIAVVNLDSNTNKSQLEIGDLKLKASPDVLRRVRHLEPYVVHYLPDSKVILSMQHIPEDDNIRQDAATARLGDLVAANDEQADADTNGTQQDQSTG